MSSIYFRPAEAQPYHLYRCAVWLTRLRYFPTVNAASTWLIDMQIHRPDIFRYYMSEYHRVHSFKTGYLTQSSDARAFRSAVGPYGEDPHMY